MKYGFAGVLSVALATQAAAGGLDLSGQSSAFLFNSGTVAELGFGSVAPNVSGNDSLLFGGAPSGNIAHDITVPFASFKHDVNEKLSFGVIYEEPFGAGLTYGPTSVAFGGTSANADTSSITALIRYKFSDRFSIFGGPRWQNASADFRLTGALYGPLSGYTATMARDDGMGYVVGAAFEIPEYFLRVALTYNSEIEHNFTTTETFGPGVVVSQVAATTPQSLNLEFISGVAPRTFVFGGARWAEWSKLQFAPPVLSTFSTDPLVQFEDTITYSLGIGRQLTDRWTATAALIFEPSTNPLTTPLAPTDGFFGASLGAIYMGEDLEIHANITALQVGDATPFVNALGTTVSSFTGNSSVAVGMKVVKKF